ncbi:phosphotransferase [Mycoplasmatota bacterium WC44]
MLENIKNDMNENILRKACNLIDVDLKDLKFAGGFENFLYSFHRDSEIMLRLSHSDHRCLEQINAEIDFIKYLAVNGVSVNKPVPLNNGKLIDTISFNEKYFSVCCFEKVEGEHLKLEDINDEFIFNYGKIIGKTHYLSKSFKPKYKRIEWYEDTYLDDHLIHFSEKDVIIVETLNVLLEDINKIPKTKENYGLIHTDMHRGNFFVKENKLNLFDFDDASYMYFISDIAIVLFYLFVLDKPDHEQNEIEHFYDVFMEGYNSENILPSECFYHMKLFLELRRIELYAICVSEFSNELRPEWATNYINTHKERIIDRDHVIDLEFK